MTFKVGDIVGGIHTTEITDPKCREKLKIKVERGGTVALSSTDRRACLPSLYKIIGVNGKFLKLEKAFIDSCEGDYSISYRSSTKEYFYECHSKYMKPLSYFTKECLVRLCKNSQQLDINKEVNIDEMLKEDLVNFVINEYNMVHNIALENTKKRNAEHEKYLQEKSDGTLFNRMKKEIIEEIENMEFNEDNEFFLWQIQCGFRMVERLKELKLSRNGSVQFCRF